MGKFCSLECTCRKHSGIFPGIAGRGRFCEQDCTCKRHNNPKLLGRGPRNKGVPHTLEAKAKMGLASMGRTPWNKGLTKESDTRVMKYARSVQQHIETCNGSCGGASCGNRENPSQLQWQVYDLLLKDFEVVIPETRFGKYSVDFLLAEEWLAVEVDGSYWHSVNKTDYKARDQYLLENFNLPVIRLSEEELREAEKGTLDRWRQVHGS